MSSFANVSIRFNNNLKQFSSQMANASRDMKKMGKQMQSAGKNMSTYLTAPILALGYVSVEAFDKQAKAIAQVEAGIKSTGGAAGYTSEQLQKMASDLQNKTIFGDEEILKGATSQLLTFTNIAGNQFERTQEAALNLATRLDGDLKSASIQLGKALNDPIANLSALSRSGIQFSEDQKAVIKSLTDSGRLADAQTIILDELEKQYGGAAEAAAKAGKGGLTQFYNIMGDIMEQFGEIVMEYLNPFVAKLKALALRFQELDKSTKKIIVVIAAFAAAIGPVLLTLGFLMTTVIPGIIALLPVLGTAFTVLTGPIGLVVAAIAGIAYMVYKHWDTIKKHMVDLQNYFIELYNESVVFRTAVQYIVFMFKTWWSVAKAVFGGIWDIIKNLGSYIVDTFKNVGAGIKAALTGDPEGVIKAYKNQAELMGKVFTDSFEDIGNQVSTLTDNISRDFNDSIDAVTSKKKIAFVKENVDASAIKEKVAEAVEKGMTGAGGSGRGQIEAISSLSSAGIIQAKSPLDQVAEKIPEQVKGISDQQMLFMENAHKFNEGLTEIVQNTAQNFVAGFGQIVGAMAAGTASASDIGKLLMGTFADMATQVGKMAIGIGLAVEGIKTALQSLNPVVAIAAGVALVALGSFAKSTLGKIGSGGGGQKVTPFANGGLVYTPTLGLMGEYSGARSNPEVIAPLDKLKGYLMDAVGDGGGSAKGEFKLRGQDLILAMDRAGSYKNRRG